MARIRTQLAIQLPDPSLLARLKAAAAAQRRTVTALALEWIEAGLSGRIADPAQADLAQRVAALEAAVSALQSGRRSTPRQRSATPARESRPAPAAAAPADAIQTAELAKHLGIARQALNGRLIRRGGARVGLVIDGWRCVGQVRGSGAARWLWQPDA